MADRTAGLVQRATKHGQENDWGNNTLECEEVLNLCGVSQVHKKKLGGLDCKIIPWYKVYIGREVEARNRAQIHTFLP